MKAAICMLPICMCCVIGAADGDGFKLPQATPRPIKSTDGKITYEGCLGANRFWAIPVHQGDQVSVTAGLSGDCESKGWSWNDRKDWAGPDGRANEHPAGALCAASPVAQLIGSVKLIDPGESLDE